MRANHLILGICAVSMVAAPAFVRARPERPRAPRTSQPTVNKADYRRMPSLIASVAASDQPGSMPIEAMLAARNGDLVAHIVLAVSPDQNPLHASFRGLTQSVLAPHRPASLRSNFTEPTLDGFRLEARVVQHSPLCLLEALCLAECVSDGQVQSIAPLERNGRSFFHVVIHRPGMRLLRAIIDPDTCELSEIVSK